MKSPFKFLDSYTKDDRNIFFGRDREIEELYQKVFDSKLLLVYGVSGTGKSSLIHCGLANKFRETDWLPLVIRRGGNIIESMAAGISSASLTEQMNKLSSPADFKKGVRSLYLDHYKPVFFIFDQFEELFIFGGKEERREFVHIVKTLIESDLQCRFIFVMREEYMAWITEFEKVIPTFFANRVRIEKMSHRNALDAIKEPCKVFNISTEEGFAETLLERLSPGSTEVELTFLQVFLDKIFRLAQSEIKSGEEDQKVTFTLSLLQKTGNVSDLLGSFLDDQISLMDDPDTAMTVLKAFVSDKGTKRPANEAESIDNIRSLGKEISQQQITELLLTFVNLRVLRDKDDNGRYELRHDSLAEKIYEKFTLAEKELLEVRQFIENAYLSFTKRKTVLSSDDLDYISNKDSSLNLNSDLKGFLIQSRQHQRAKMRTIKRLIVISAFAFLLLLSTIIYAVIQRSLVSKSVILAKESITQFSRPIDRLCLAAEAWKAHKGEEAKEALLKAFNNALRNPGTDKGLIGLSNKYLPDYGNASAPIEIAGCSPDNRFIYYCTADSIFVKLQNGIAYSAFPQNNSQAIYLLISNDGQYIGAITKDTTLNLWDNNGKLQFKYKTKYNSLNTEQVFRFDPNDKVVVISENSDADILDIKGTLIQSLNQHNSNANALDISEDGKFIATSGNDSTVNIWYYNSDSEKFDLYNSLKFPSDSIYSVDFAKKFRHVLTTSASRVRITNINGVLAWGIRDSFTGDMGDKIPLGSPYLAEFDETSSGIVISSYLSKNNREDDFKLAMYVDIFERSVIDRNKMKFDYIKYSPDKKYIATSNGNELNIITRNVYLVSNYAIFKNYRLLQIEGKKPFFTHDGKFVMTINGNHLESWFIDIETIAEVALEYYSNWNGR